MRKELLLIFLFLFLATTVIAAPQETTTVRKIQTPVVYRAVGTVHSSLEAKVMAQTSGRLVTISVAVGAVVEQDTEIASIEDKQLTLRKSQALSGAEAARAQKLQAEHGKVGALAALAQARSEFERVKKMHSQRAATPQQLEQTEAAYKQAQSAVSGAEEAIKAAAAALTRANDAAKEVDVALGYTRVKAPFAGTVSHKFVDPGDLAWPGRPLFQIIDTEKRRLEANVREGLAGHIKKEQKLKVVIPALEQEISGTVEEISPAADPSSRTFKIKVALGEDGRLLPGMFGRLEIPTGTKEVVIIPHSSVRKMGQLNIVQIKDGQQWRNRIVRLGEELDEGYEVLSGLREGETIAKAYGEVH